MDSIGVQEEDRESMSQIVTGTEQTAEANADGSAQKRLPTELEHALQTTTDEFKTDAMKKMNDYVCTEPGLNPMVSVAEPTENGASPMQIFMCVFTLALATMSSQVTSVKLWYRKHLGELEKLESERTHTLEAVGEELRSAIEELQQIREEKDQLMNNADTPNDDNRARSPLGEQLSPPSSLAQNTQGYVRVEKHASGEDGSVKFRVEDVTQRESELEKKITKLKLTQKQLVEANTEWERHCRELNDHQEKQIKNLTDEFHRRTEKEQQKCAERMEESKRQYEYKLTSISEELARKEAAYQSLRERTAQQSETTAAVQLKPVATDTKRTDVSLAKRVEELELQVQDLRHERTRNSPQHAAPLNLNTENRQTASSSSRSTVDNLNSKLRQYKTQITVLQAQITTFKEDFDNEKADKDRAKIQKVEIQQQLQRVLAENADLKRLVNQKDRESEAVRNQNDFVRTQYTQKCRDLDTERAKHKDFETKIARLQSQLRHYQQQAHENQMVNITRPPTTTSGPHNDSVWQCPHCTYENIYPRTFCEICGLKSPRVLPSRNFETDNPRLLARNVEQSDTGNHRTSTSSSRKHTTSSSKINPYYMRDIEPDTQYVDTDCI